MKHWFQLNNRRNSDTYHRVNFDSITDKQIYLQGEIKSFESRIAMNQKQLQYLLLDWHLSARSVNALKRAGVQSDTDFIERWLDLRETHITNFGKVSMAETDRFHKQITKKIVKVFEVI
jgi:hypothetical protein